SRTGGAALGGGSSLPFPRAASLPRIARPWSPGKTIAATSPSDRSARSCHHLLEHHVGFLSAIQQSVVNRQTNRQWRALPPLPLLFSPRIQDFPNILGRNHPARSR